MAEDFKAQLNRSVLEIERAGNDVLFDRCPADLLAYLLVEGQDIEQEIQLARHAMHLLDLVVFVPIQEPDRIALSSHENRGWRHAVGETLAESLLDNELVEDVLTARGAPTARVEQVMSRVRALGGCGR